MRMGYVDVARRDQIAGWAADPDMPDAVQELVVLVNGREAGRIKADRFRQDLQRLGHFGEGRHGFVFHFAPPLDPAGEYDVVVRYADAADAVLQRGAFRIAPELDPENAEPPSVRFYSALPERPRPAPAKPRYVLHVGLPKTGTKYLQSNFWRLREQLRARGVYYPSQWWKEHPIFAHHELADSLKEAPNGRIAEIFAQLNACGSAVVLLSSEGFNPVPESGLAYLRELTAGAKVDIVLYARRWSDWMPSQWQQAVKQGSVQTFPEWHALLLSTADRHPGINQALFLDKFAKIFGRESIRLVSYSNLMDRKVDLFLHFCQHILNFAEPLPPTGAGDLVHESMGIFVTELVRGLNSREAACGATPGFHVFHTYHLMQANPDIAGDVKFLVAAMERHVGELVIDDNARFLDYGYERLNEYRDRMVGPEYGRDVFGRQVRSCRYVRPDYFLEPRAAEALGRVARAVRDRLEKRAAAA